MKKIVLGILILVSFVVAKDMVQKSPFLTGKFQATGYSAAHQSRFAALIAAKVDAQRQLLEQIKGTKIDSETTIENGMMKSDIITTKIKGLLKNARVVKESYDPSNGTASVTMAIGFNKVASQIFSDRNLIKDDIENRNVINKTHIIQNSNVKKDEPIYDGLIVDVRGLNMEPAMINRVYSKNEIVYDPTKVPQTIIVERGLAAYTIDINKAKAILETYCSKKPIVVKAVKLLDKKSDVDISKRDADLILMSDLKNGFLSSAKVVFVLDD